MTTQLPENVKNLIIDGYFASCESICPYDLYSKRWTTKASAMLWLRGHRFKNEGISLDHALDPNYSLYGGKHEVYNVPTEVR